MDDVTFHRAPGQPAFTEESRQGVYITAFPLAPGEPDALSITAPFMQLANSYSRPAANSNIAFGSVTAYFDDDVDFQDLGGGMQTWTRRWLTKPNSWMEPGGTYAYTYPAYSAGIAFGSLFPATAIDATGANAVINTNATGISAGTSVLFDLNYVRNAANYHVTFVTSALAASSGTSITIPNSLPGDGNVSSVSGNVRSWSTGRSTPEALEVDSWLLHDYAISTAQNVATDLPQVDRFNPVDVLGNDTLYLVTGLGSTPNSTTYAQMVAADQFIVARPSETRRYGAGIYERVTLVVKAR